MRSIMTVRVADIKPDILNNITKKYKGHVANFVKTELCEKLCFRVICDKELLSNVIFANDMGVPPVKSLLEIYTRELEDEVSFVVENPEVRKSVGAVMGYVFRFVLGYHDKVDYCTIGRNGFKTASRFINGNIVKLM